MRKLILVVVLAAMASPAFAMTGFLRSQYQEGGDTHCVYDALGHKYDMNIGIGICDLTIEVND